MIIKKEKNSIVYSNEGASGYLINNRNNCEYVRLVLESGSKIEKHSLPFNVTFYILKGNPAAVVDDQIYETKEGDLLEVEKDLLRSWQNNSNSIAEILVIKHI